MHANVTEVMVHNLLQRYTDIKRILVQVCTNMQYATRNATTAEIRKATQHTKLPLHTNLRSN